MLKKIFMILVVSSFTSSSFAYWGYQKNYTVCKGGNCHHTTVKKGCVNGHCGKVRYGTTWHR